MFCRCGFGLLAFAGFLAGALAGVQERLSSTIYGTVLPAEGETRLPDELVVILRTLEGGIVRSAPAREGRFVFRDIQTGDYLLTVEAGGYRTLEKHLGQADFDGSEVTVILLLGPRLGEPPRSRRDTQRTVDAGVLRVPPDARREYERAGRYLEQGRLEKARGGFEKAIRLYPRFAAAYNNLGAVYLRLRRLKEAETALATACEIDSRSVPARKNLGYIYLVTGRPGTAAEVLTLAATLTDSDPEVYAFLGEAIFQSGRPDDAEAPLKKALDLNPRLSGVSYRLGKIHMDAGRLSNALEYFEKFLATNIGMDTTQVLQWMAAIRTAQGVKR